MNPADLSDCHPGAIFLCSEDGVILYAHGSALGVYGYLHQELVGKKVEQLYARKDRYHSQVAEQGAHSEAKGEGYFEDLHLKKDSSSFPVLVAFRRLPWGNGGKWVHEHTVFFLPEVGREEGEKTEVDNKYQILFEHSSDGFFIVRDEVIIDCNRRACEIFGAPKEKLIGRSPVDLSPPVQPNGQPSRKAGRVYIEAALSGKPQTFYWQHKKHYHQPVDTQVSLQRLTVGGERVLCGQIRDITSALADREQLSFQQNIISQISDAIVAMDVQERITYWNGGAEQLFGAKASEALGNTLADIIRHRFPSEDLAAEVEVELARTGKWYGEVVYSGTVTQDYYLDVSLVSLKDRQGGLNGFLGVIRDISKRKRSEQELRHTKELLEALVRSAPVSIDMLGRDGRFRMWNPAAERLFGLNAKEVLGKPYVSIFAGNADTQGHQEMAEAVLTGCTYKDMESKVVTKDGKKVVVSLSAAPVYNAEGKIVAGVRFATDITKTKIVAEELLRQSSITAALLQNAASLNEQLDLQTVLDRVCHEAAASLKVTAACVYLLDEVQCELRISGHSAGMPGEMVKALKPIPYSVCQELFAGPVLHIRDIQTCEDFSAAEYFIDFGCRTLSAVQLKRDRQLVGVLFALNVESCCQHSPDELVLLRGLADQAAQAIANARLYEEATRRLSFLQGLREVDKSITASLDLEVILRVYLTQVTGQLGVDAANVLLLDPHTNTLDFFVGRGFKTNALRYSRLSIGQGFAGRAALERRMVSVSSIAEEENAFRASPLFAEEKFHCYFAVPLIAKGQVNGVLELYHRSPIQVRAEWLGFLDAFANQGAIAIDNVRLYQALQRANTDLTMAYDTTLLGWSRALDLRDKETEGHSVRVRDMAELLAQRVGLSGRSLLHLRRGALLHDIGKMGIPDSILLKPGPLDEHEWTIMQQHPVLAYQLLSPINFLLPALDIPYCHHERWDGSGYPRGLKGEQIPISARIFSVVDVYDALCSDRPYRPAWSSTQAIDYIKEQSGSHFDPQVVQAFVEGNIADWADGAVNGRCY